MRKTRMYVIKLNFLNLPFKIALLALILYICVKAMAVAPKPNDALIDISLRSSLPINYRFNLSFLDFKAPKFSDIFISASPIFWLSYNGEGVDNLHEEVTLTPSPTPSIEPSSPEPTQTPVINEENIIENTITKTSETGYTSINDIFINNQTDAKVDILQLIKSGDSLKAKKDEPLVLIVHAHTSESYRPTEKFFYIPTDNDRTEDNRFNVVRVGEEFSKVLSENEIAFVHDKSLNDYPSYNGSYQKTLEVVSENLKKYPSIKVVIDIHRDAIIKPDKSKVSLIFDHEGTTAAQVMLVVGTNKSGLYHPNWENNLSFALKWQHEMLKVNKNLPRPINLRKERFNGHVTNNAVILEVGTSANTLEEALEGARLCAKALCELLK